jgi:acyl-coenzyme A synthetase/AMP-(fatty) acid ligase
VKGQAIYAFVTLSDEAGRMGDREQIKKALVGHIRAQIGESH